MRWPNLNTDARRSAFNRYVKVGFSPRQANALAINTWSIPWLVNAGFTRHQAKALLTGSLDVAQIMTEANLSRPQAELIHQILIVEG